MEKIVIESSQRAEFIEITSQINDLVKQSGVKDGICHLTVPHTTCALTINENADPSVKADIIAKLGRLIPRDDAYTHLEGNSDAHIKSSLLGHTLSIFIENSSLLLGIWQGIFLCEFDGPRRREVWLKIDIDTPMK